ncbi:MAG: alpha-L-fucosidase [Verrucomicrobia bacterium]|nr:alpha-L-fucosidase [Verrucomicrobiota bacterium]MCH8512538.1 alpha-L-fucosidase [Kiritimatiellia bacterium]
MPDFSWFRSSAYGMFLHWTPAAAIGRGEQVLMREWLDQREYAKQACAWNPEGFDARAWAALAKASGMRYAVMVTKHHDGYCLWDSKLTDYTSVCQAPKRDFVREYVEAFRAEGIRVGLYFSLGDFRIPAYFQGPRHDPQGWARFVAYTHAQVEELLTHYGQIDELWFDGAWPRSAVQWRSVELLEKIRALQPGLLVNNRLDAQDPDTAANDQVEMAGESKVLGDFGTPEHRIASDPNRPWESCQVTTHRLWGYTRGEYMRDAETCLEMLCECASKGGNLLLNIAPDADGVIPETVQKPLRRIGDWLEIHGEAIYGTDRDGAISDSVTYGYQTRKGNDLYLIFRFWPSEETLPIFGLDADVETATLLSTGRELHVGHYEHGLLLKGLPVKKPNDLFPVVRLRCRKPPTALPCAKEGLWSGDPRRFVPWAATRGNSVWVDGIDR